MKNIIYKRKNPMEGQRNSSAKQLRTKDQAKAQVPGLLGFAACAVHLELKKPSIGESQ